MTDRRAGVGRGRGDTGTVPPRFSTPWLAELFESALVSPLPQVFTAGWALLGVGYLDDSDPPRRRNETTAGPGTRGAGAAPALPETGSPGPRHVAAYTTPLAGGVYRVLVVGAVPGGEELLGARALVVTVEPR